MSGDRMDTELFDAYYFSHGCGRPYQRDKEWLDFFASIADRIVSDIEPKTVLDAGCAMGFLVEALRERGVEAYGIDISEYAIDRVHEDVKEYCWVGSVTEPLPQSYDLIVCIEVLEHLQPADAQQALINLCQHADDILFSSTPFDYKEVTHFNVKTPEHWAEMLAREGFFRDVDFDASFITPWAFRSRRRTDPVPRVVRDYERRFWSLWKENTDLRDLAGEMRDQLASESRRANEERQRAEEVSDNLRAVLTSRSWKSLLTLQRLRLRLIPLGSSRDRVLKSVTGALIPMPTEQSSGSGLGPTSDQTQMPLLASTASTPKEARSSTQRASGSRKLRIALYSPDPIGAACPHLRIAGPASHISSGIELLVAANWVNGSLKVDLPDDADVVLIQRDFPRYEASYLEVVGWARSLGKPVTYELDDLLLELPLEHPEKQYYDEARSQMLEAAAEADAVVASTHGIADYLRQFNPRTWLLPNYLDDRLWSFRETKGDDSPYVVVGYMGGRTQTHIPDLESITPVLTRLLDSYPGRLKLRFWGTFPQELADHPNVDFRTETHADYASFAEYFSRQNCDVFIGPLIDNSFNRSKSWLKFLEYSSLAIPGVYSRLAPYENVVAHGENGFLASTHEEWESHLRMLIDNRERRLSVGRAAQDTIRRRMLLSKHAHEWGTVYRAIHSSAKQRRSSVPRQVLDQQLHRWEREQHATSEGAIVASGGEKRPDGTFAVSDRPPTVGRLRLLVNRGLIVLRREGPLDFARAVIRRTLSMLAFRRKDRRFGASADHYGIAGGRRTGRERDPGNAPIVSIAIPVLNGLEFVRDCIDSILDSPVSLRFEIILIDQGSRHGTLKLLRNFVDGHPNIVLVENKTNVGFGPAINQAAAVARGEFIAILNSDVIVTPGWLDKLVEPLQEDLTLGITSPVTNYVGEGPQIDPNAKDVTPQGAAIYAQEVSSRAGIEPVVDRLVFFSVVVRKKIFDYLGGLATVFGLGNYEDEDFCLRVRMAGFSLGIVPGSFVFHHGSRTFKEQNVDHTALMLRNEKIYFERVSFFATQQPFLANRPGNQDQPLLSVIVRTKDRPHLLRQALTCLANQTAKRFEVVLVNDGGVDVSWLISAFSPNMTIKYVENDRSPGRAPALNTGLASARGRWITYLDDDDIVYPTHLEHLMGALTKDDGYKVAYSDVNKALCWSDLRSDQVLERAHFSRKAYDPKALLVENWIPIMSLMHSADCVQDIGGFDDNLQIFEDWDFLIRLSRAYEFSHVPRITCEYRFRFGDVGEETTLQSRENALETMLLIHNRYPTADKRTQDLRAIAVDASRQIIEEMRLIDVTDGSDLDRKLLATARLGGFSMASPLDIPHWPLSPSNLP